LGRIIAKDYIIEAGMIEAPISSAAMTQPALESLPTDLLAKVVSALPASDA
jgi:hypothetical protein